MTDRTDRALEPLRSDERWQRCKAAIGQRVSPEDAATWVPTLELHEVQPHRIVLGGIPNSFFRRRIASRFQLLILDSVREGYPDVAFASEPQLDLRVNGTALPAEGVRAAAAHTTSERITLSVDRDYADETGEDTGDTAPAAPPENAPARAPHRLETFLAAPGNASALHFARQVLEAPGRTYNPLLVVGESGLGKTHLLQALAAALPAPGADAPVLYVSGEAFKNEVLDGITRKSMPAVRARYRAAGALLLDDLDFLLVSPKAQEELLHTFDVLHGAGRQLVFSAQRFPRALGGLNDALRSRLEMGLIAELLPPDVQTRRTLVERRAEAAGLRLPEAVTELLARRISRNLRRLEGAVVRLSAYAALHGRTITPEFAAQYTAPFFDTEPGNGQRLVQQDAILERVAERFGVTVRHLKGRGRTPTQAGARRIAVHLLKELGERSYSEIGSLLGNRSHSTMVHAHQTLRADMARDERLQGMVHQLARSLSPE